MPLRYQGPNQFSFREFVDNNPLVSNADLQNLVDRFVSRSRQNGADTRRIAERNQRLPADRSFLSRIESQGRPLQTTQIAVQKREVSVARDFRNLHRYTRGLVGEIRSHIRDFRLQSLDRKS